MEMIEERAIHIADTYSFNESINATEDVRRLHRDLVYSACVEIAYEQKAIDEELCKRGLASDGYHTFSELYNFRREYNAALVNTGVWKAHKSHRHHDGELCFGGGWFIVMIETPYGQISNHYEDMYWDEFHCEEKEIADEWDGHTEKDVVERLRKCNTKEE